MSKSIGPFGLVLLLGPTVILEARAETYMTEEEAVKLIFPEGRFERKEFTLSDADAEDIFKSSEQKVRSTKVACFVGSKGKAVFIDRVYGKHELITYAVGVDEDGKVSGIEIMDYRESYGYQVRRKEWRSQFVGRGLSSKFKVGEDVTNISGATLSTVHISGGIKRVLATYGLIKSRF